MSPRRRSPHRLDLSDLTRDERIDVYRRLKARTFKRWNARAFARFGEAGAVCYEWEGYRTPPAGHGQIRVRGELQYVHRVAYALERGPIPAGKIIRHACDNPPCWNGLHLELGSKLENDTVDRRRRLEEPTRGCRGCGAEVEGSLEYCHRCGRDL